MQPTHSHDHQALQNLPCPVIQCDDTLVVVAWTHGAEQLFGYASEEAVGKNLVGFLLDERDATAWRQLAEQGGSLLLKHTRNDGSTIVCQWCHTTLRDKDGQVIGTLCLGQDVTALTQKTERLEQHDSMFRLVLDSLPIVVCAYDSNGRFSFIDGKGLQGAGVQPGQLVGQSIFDSYGKEPATAEAIHRTLAGEPTYLRSESHDISWESWLRPVRDPASQQVTGIISVTLNVSDSMIKEELQAKLDLIERQQKVIRELSTPIIEVWDGVLTLPMVGIVDSTRTAEVMQNLLDAVVTRRARFAILDLTGVEMVDTNTANYLIRLVQAIRLLGAQGIITGIRPMVAQTVVSLGLDLSGIPTRGNLRAGLMYCIERLRAEDVDRG